MRLKGKVAVVTGGGTGIGRGICLRFAHEGAAVVVNYAKSRNDALEVVDTISGLGGQALAVHADITQDHEARRLVQEALSGFKRLDVLVNNAGWTKRVPHHQLEELDEETLDRTWSVNVKGHIYCVRAAVPHLRVNGGGSIINITSNAAFTADGSSIIYCAAKAALTSLTKSLARALAPEIRVNAIAPGFVDTGLVNWSPERREQLKTLTRLEKQSTPEDVADAAVFLVANASATTGQTILVDGGVSALGPNA
jgi:3-oxoacyl-[acyl-carrier protein] reductase